jgi:hypothetical protein
LFRIRNFFFLVFYDLYVYYFKGYGIAGRGERWEERGEEGGREGERGREESIGGGRERFQGESQQVRKGEKRKFRNCRNLLQT